MGVTRTQMLDLLATSTSRLPKAKLIWTQGKQRYEVVNKWFGKDKEVVRGGNRVEERCVLSATGAAQHVQPYQVNTVNVPQFIETQYVDWVSAKTQWTVEQTEISDHASGESKESWAKGFIDLVKARRTAALVDMSDLLEDAAWAVPPVDTNNITPLGLPYWVPKLASGQAATAAGFYGGRYSTAFTNVGGIAPATSGDNTTAIAGGKERWRSYQAGYVTVNDTLVKTLSLAYMKINFQSPILMEKLLDVEAPENMFRIYANAATIVDVEALARANNDQLGGDIAMYQGTATFKRLPWIYMPALDSTASGAAGQYNPIYLINHNWFKVYVKSDLNLAESEAMNDVSQNLVYTTFIDLRYAFMCTNRRNQACINQVA